MSVMNSSRHEKIHKKNLTEHIIWQLSKISRIRFCFLASKTDVKALSIVYLFISSFISVLIIGIAAHFTSWNLIFPSLGPTIFLQFYAPQAPMSAPKNTILGHLIGALIGLFFYWISVNMGLSSDTTALGNILIGALAVGTSGTLMVLTELLHPPAASTTLIAAFGFLENPVDIFAIVVSAAVLSMEAWLLHKLAGIRYPMWSPLEKEHGPRIATKLGLLSFSPEKDKPCMEEIAAKLASRQKLK